MPSTITVGSKAHAAIRITEPMPEKYKDKPGEAPALRTITLNGANHADAKFGLGVTKGVDADVFHKWLDSEKNANTNLAGLVSEMSEEEAAKDSPVGYGFEPGLKALAADAENTAKASEGSTVKEAGPVTAADMKATTVIPATLAAVPADQIPNDMTKPAKDAPPAPPVVPPAIPPAPTKA